MKKVKIESLNDFLLEAGKVHLNKFDYSLVNFETLNQKVKIICKKHKIVFEQTAKRHIFLEKNGCNNCKHEKRVNKVTKTKDFFLQKAKEIHGDYYNYEKVNYKNLRTKIILVCPQHGEFEIKPRNHIEGIKIGCRYCYSKTRLYNPNDFIYEAKAIFGDKYDYSLFEFTKLLTKSKIICKQHGVFFQSPSNHLQGKNGCRKCYLEKTGSTLENCLIRFKKMFGEKYNYSEVKYINNHTPVKIICEKHGAFYRTPNYHQKGGGCPDCKEPIGETMVKSFLVNNNIDFIKEKKFSDCKGIKGGLLRFDFYLPKFNVCIEYDGPQHFQPIKIYDDIKGFEIIQKHDELKYKYCEQKNILLIRIKYLDRNKISEILASKLKININD